MKEISSASILLDHSLSLNEILSLHQFSKTYSGTVFLLCEHKFITTNHLPKLVSFLLTRKNQEIRIVAEGHNVEQTLEKIHSFLKPASFKKNTSKKVKAKRFLVLKGD